MTDSIQYLTANWRDLNAVRKIEKLCFPQDAWPIWDILGALSFPNTYRLKALAGEELVGFLAGEVEKDKKIAWVSTICVHPEFQRRGIATRMMELYEDSVEYPRVRLVVRKSNQAAIALYRKYGYSDVGYRRKYYVGGEDGLVMEKILQP